MTIKITLPEPCKKGDAQSAVGTRVFNHEGAEIKNITSIDIRIRPDEIIEANINVAINSDGSLDNINALLGTETLNQIAELHGCELTPRSTVRLSDGIVSHQDCNSKLAAVNFKVDCSQIDEIQAILDVLAKYSDELPQAMKDELSEIIKEK